MNALFANTANTQTTFQNNYIAMDQVKESLRAKLNTTKKKFKSAIVNNSLIINSPKTSCLKVEIRDLLGDLHDIYNLDNTVFTQINLSKYDLLVCDITITDNRGFKKNMKHILS